MLSGLLDSDLDGGLNLFLLEGNGEHAVLELGLDAVLVLAYLNRQSDGARELAPVALLDVPASGLLVFPTGQDARDGENVV